MRSWLTWLLLILVVLLAGLYLAGPMGDRQSGEQPSPHALDQSQ